MWRGRDTCPVWWPREGLAVGLGMGAGNGSGMWWQEWWHSGGVPPLHRVPCPCWGEGGAARSTGRTLSATWEHSLVNRADGVGRSCWAET